MDSAGVSMGGTRFRITMPYGTVHEGRLDVNGFVRIDGIDPGECEVEFPDLDGREWGRGRWMRRARHPGRWLVETAGHVRL